MKVAVLPLVKKDGQPELAREIYRALRGLVQAEYDDGGAIGKRYRRQDEIGTPFCVTIDHESVAGGHRNRARPRLARPRSACRSRVSRQELQRRVQAPWRSPKLTEAPRDRRFNDRAPSGTGELNTTVRPGGPTGKGEQRHGLRPDRRAAPDPGDRARVHRQGDRRAQRAKTPATTTSTSIWSRRSPTRATSARSSRASTAAPASTTSDYGLVVEEIGRGCSSVRTVISVQTSLVCSAILKWGTEEQKRKYLPKLCSGEWLGCFGLTEPDTGSDAANQRTRARKTDSGWVINGAKMWISMGNYAKARADLRPDRPRRRATGASACFLVDTDQPGFKAQTIEHKMGLHASDTASIALEDVEVADDGHARRGRRRLQSRDVRARLRAATRWRPAAWASARAAWRSR